MSHFTEVATQFKDQAALIAALEEVYGEGSVEVSEKGAALFGYQGDNRAERAKNDPNYAPTCNVVVRRKFIGPASNDIGFRQTEDGTYAAYVSDYDRPRWDTQLVAQKYSKLVTYKVARLQGFQVKEEVKEGKIKLTLTKY